MTRVLRDERLASRLITRSGHHLQGESVASSSRSSSSPASLSTPVGGPPKRCATAVMLETLTTGLGAVREPRLVRERFEEELRALVRATSVTFRQDATTPTPEVVFRGSGSAVDDRQGGGRVRPSRRQTTARDDAGGGGQVAGLLLEIERANGDGPGCARSRRTVRLHYVRA